MLPGKIFHRTASSKKGLLFYVFGFLVYFELALGTGMLLWAVTYPIHNWNIFCPGLGLFAGILLILHLFYKKAEAKK